MAAKTWAATVNTVSDAWSVAARWTPSAPATNDQVFIGNTTQIGAFAVTEDVTLTISSLTMAGNHKSSQTTTLTVTQPATLTVTGAIDLGADAFINGTGTLVANGVITGAGTIIASNGGLLDIAGIGSIASGIVLDFDISTSLASTLRLDLAGGVTSAANIRMNNTAQVLDIGAATTLTIAAPETIAKGTLRLSGGTVIDPLGITVGGNGAAGAISGRGTIQADITGGGPKAVVNTITASGGTLTIAGAFNEGAGGAFIAAIDAATPSTLKFEGAALLDQPIAISSAAQTLEIGAAGALTMAGLDIVTFGTIRMDGGSLADTAGIFIDTGATLIGMGTVTAGTTLSGDGAVIASGGTLELASDISSPFTSFGIDATGASVLRIDGAVAAPVTFAFLGGAGVLQLADIAAGVLQGFAGSIAGLAIGASATTPANMVNFQSAATSAVQSGGTITIFNGATTVATLRLATVPHAGTYAVLQPDATRGGVDVFLSDAPPDAPSTPNLATASDSGLSATDNLTNVTTPGFTGTAQAGTLVTLFDSAIAIGTATADPAGHWSITAATLAEGTHAIAAIATDGFGNTSPASAALAVTIDTTPPPIPSITRATATSIGGTAAPGARVTLSDGATPLGTAVTGGGGAWSLPSSLAPGSHPIAATATDLAGNASPASPATLVIGTIGADTLTSGPAFAIFLGGAGDDTYTVRNPLDVVIENPGDGTADRILAATSYALPAGAEVEVLRAITGAPALALSGNSLPNTIIGGAGNDTLNGAGGNDALNGGAGADVMSGGTGNDSYTVDNPGDVVAEDAGAGNDTVAASIDYTLGAGAQVEFLHAAPGATFLSLGGNEVANRVTGTSGADTIAGGGGADTLTGGGGADRFVFITAAESTPLGRDVIQDFSTLDGDTLDLHLIDANALLAGDQGFTFIGTAGFSGTAGELRTVAGANTSVLADLDGDRIADLSILLRGAHALSAANFTL